MTERLAGLRLELAAEREAHRETRDALDSLVERSTDGVVVVAQAGRIRFANPAAATLLGRTGAELNGADFGLPLSEPEATTELEVVRPDEHPCFLEMRVRRITWRGEPASFVALRDVTALRLGERQTRSMLELVERSNQELERFAYIASHDLQEPLRTVKGYVDLLALLHGSQLNEEASDFVRRAVEGVTRMETLIREILSYARLHTEHDRTTVVDTADIVTGVMADLAGLLEQSGAAVTLPTDLPRIHGDPTQLRRLFENLLANALKFRGDVPPEIALEVSRRRGEWEFVVCDNGIGIPEGQEELIFGAFQRLHPRDRYEGTGIGLAVCRKIVDLHGGRIWGENRPEGGASFHFTLPHLNIDAIEAGQ